MIQSTSRSISAKPLILLGLLGMALASFGCAFGEIRPGDPFDRQYTLDEAHHRYTILMRFSEFHKARSFVAEEDREDFNRRTKALSDARFTDFESELPELDDDKRKATVVVTYTVYTASLPYEVQVSETQEWHRDGLTNNWRVRSTFEGLQNLAIN